MRVIALRHGDHVHAHIRDVFAAGGIPTTQHSTLALRHAVVAGAANALMYLPVPNSALAQWVEVSFEIADRGVVTLGDRVQVVQLAVRHHFGKFGGEIGGHYLAALSEVRVWERGVLDLLKQT